MAKNQTQKSDIDCKFFENASDVPDRRQLSPDKKNLMVFDDLLLERQNKCEAYVRYPKPPNSINSTILFTYFIVTHRNAR